jgi:hypothetical protein
MDIKCLYKYEQSVYISFILNLSEEYSFKKLEKGGRSVISPKLSVTSLVSLKEEDVNVIYLIILGSYFFIISKNY